MVKITSSIHNHTTFCDGHSTAEDMVLAAIAKGLKTIGFSAHSYTPCDDSYCLRDTDAYFAELARLKEAYADQIDILAGLEVDCYGDSDPRADYVIISVHNVLIGGRLYVVDYSKEELLKCIRECYAGDVYALVEDYYNTVSASLKRERIDLVGHLDLVTKFNEQLPLIDESHPRYVAAVRRVLAELDGKKLPLEINTGGVYRGYKEQFYPSVTILNMLRDYDIPVCVTADAHSQDGIDYAFDKAVELCRELGIKEIWQLEKSGFCSMQI